MIKPAILYQQKDYITNQERLMGRQSATESFLNALAKYGKTDTMYCYSLNQKEFEAFCQQINQSSSFSRNLAWIPYHTPVKLDQAGLLYRPDPILTSLAWQRRYHDQRAYSLCGVTHTIASKSVIENFANVLIAPLQPWDAIICTSEAVKTMVENLLENWGEYLQKRFNISHQIKPQLQLPVIPLGIDTQKFHHPTKAQELNIKLRQQLGIDQDDLVVLFVGRLISHGKAHPVPMYLALEQAAQAMGKKIYLIEAGWFEDQTQEVGFKTSAKTFSQHLNHLIIDGRHPANRQNIWCIADLFISLVDNIQETFGLTPLEAMANGLPVVVSDWNGYKETVTDGVEGFKIKTIIPPSGSGLPFAQDYANDLIDYSAYIGYSSMATAVDIPQCTQVLINLLTQPELRRKLGENGRKKVLEIYDWQVIIKQYEDLWQQLEEIRQQGEIHQSDHSHPLFPDPFDSFQHYASEVLEDDHVLILGSLGNSQSLNLINQIWITNLAPQTRLSPSIINQIVQTISIKQQLTVGEIINLNHQLNPLQIYRTLVYLIKFDVLRIIPSHLKNLD